MKSKKTGIEEKMRKIKEKLDKEEGRAAQGKMKTQVAPAVAAIIDRESGGK